MVSRALLLVAAMMAATPAAAQMRVVGADETARFAPLELGKSIVIDLPAVVADVLVARPDVANVIMRTNTRAYIVATRVGDTGIYFFDAQKRRIDALDIAVRPMPVQTAYPLEPKQVVTVVRGSQISALACTATDDFSEGARCYEAPP